MARPGSLAARPGEGVGKALHRLGEHRDGIPAAVIDACRRSARLRIRLETDSKKLRKPVPASRTFRVAATASSGACWLLSANGFAGRDFVNDRARGLKVAGARRQLRGMAGQTEEADVIAAPSGPGSRRRRSPRVLAVPPRSCACLHSLARRRGWGPLPSAPGAARAIFAPSGACWLPRPGSPALARTPSPNFLTAAQTVPPGIRSRLGAPRGATP